jgi:hypothetical protein
VIDETDADLETLTEGAGPHPLFNGVQRCVVVGLREPTFERNGKAVDLRAPGLTMHFDGAEITTRGQVILIEVAATP